MKVKTFQFVLHVFSLFVTQQVRSFNLATSASTRRVFVQEENDISSTNNINKPFFGYSVQVGKSQSESGNVVNLVVGAPLEYVLVDTTNEKPEEGFEPSPVLKAAVKYTPSMGAVYNCGMLQDDFKNNSYSKTNMNCSNKAQVKRGLTGADFADRDALGISLTSQELNSQQFPVNAPNYRVVACSHLRAHNCGVMYKTEGSCYVSETVPGRGDGRYSTKWNQRTPCRQSCMGKNIDVMFLVDGSKSITEPRFEDVKEWVINVASGFDIEEQVQVGVVQYSHYYKKRKTQLYLRTEISLGQYKDEASFAKAVRNISYQGYTTYTAHAIIKTVRDDFNGGTSRYPDARRVMILLTDGNSTDKESLHTAVRYAENEGVTSFAVGVKGYILGELELIAGTKDRVITVDDFDELSGIVTTIQYGIQVMEGANQNANITNGLMQCQAGISSEISLWQSTVIIQAVLEGLPIVLQFS